MPREDGEDQKLEVGQMELSLARTACLFDSALGRALRTPDSDLWSELDTLAYRAALLAVVARADAMNEDGQVTVSELAELANGAWQEVVKPGQPRTPFAAIAPPIREKWRYLAKHVWNLLDYEGSEDGIVQGHEEQITAMFAARLSEIGHTKP